MIGKAGGIAVILGVLWLVWQRIQDVYYTTIAHKDENKLAKTTSKIQSQAGKTSADKSAADKAVSKYEDSK